MGFIPWTCFAGTITTSVNAIIVSPHLVKKTAFPTEILVVVHLTVATVTHAISLVYPFLYEGPGLPVLEAMACGAPVITSNQSALPDVAGQACILVDPHDGDAIADAIGRIVTDPVLRRDLAQTSRPQAQPFTWQRAAEMTWQVLEQAADSSR